MMRQKVLIIGIRKYTSEIRYGHLYNFLSSLYVSLNALQYDPIMIFGKA